MGVAAVVDRWQVGVGVNGIANRMDWTGVERTNYVLDSLFSGGEFIDLPTTPVDDARVELPVDIRANGAYNSDAWMGIVDMATATMARRSARATNTGSTASSFAAAGDTSTSGGSQPAASVSMCQKGSASMSRRSGRAPIWNENATWQLRYRCG